MAWFKDGSELFKLYFLAKKKAFRPQELKELFLLGGLDISRSRAEAYLRASKFESEGRQVTDTQIDAFLCGVAHTYSLDIEVLRSIALGDDKSAYMNLIYSLESNTKGL